MQDCCRYEVPGPPLRCSGGRGCGWLPPLVGHAEDEERGQPLDLKLDKYLLVPANLCAAGKYCTKCTLVHWAFALCRFYAARVHPSIGTHCTRPCRKFLTTPFGQFFFLFGVFALPQLANNAPKLEDKAGATVSTKTSIVRYGDGLLLMTNRCVTETQAPRTGDDRCRQDDYSTYQQHRTPPQRNPKGSRLIDCGTTGDTEQRPKARLQ